MFSLMAAGLKSLFRLNDEERYESCFFRSIVESQKVKDVGESSYYESGSLLV